ncbi:hypothetical protein L9F63_001587, partial [Diploptera punctata]
PVERVIYRFCLLLGSWGSFTARPSRGWWRFLISGHSVYGTVAPQWRCQGWVRHECGARLAEGLHREGRRGVHPGRWNSDQPPGPRSQLYTVRLLASHLTNCGRTGGPRAILPSIAFYTAAQFIEDTFPVWEITSK